MRTSFSIPAKQEERDCLTEQQERSGPQARASAAERARAACAAHKLGARAPAHSPCVRRSASFFRVSMITSSC